MVIRWGHDQFTMRWVVLGLLSTGPLAWPSEPWARSSVGSSISDSWRTIPPPGEEPEAGSIRFSLSAGLEGFPYASNLYNEAFWSDYSASFHGGIYDKPFIAHADGTAGITTQHGNPSWAEFRELYLGTTPLALKESQLHLGRQWVQWSRLDEEFNLGLTQPRFRWNPLKPASVGLTGAFLNLDARPFHLLLYGSFLSIPERSYPLEVESGRLTSPSPYFTPPPSSVVVNGVTTPTYYSIAMPPLDQLLLQKSLGARAEIGDSRDGPWGSVMWLYKPLNQVSMNFNYNLNVAVNPIRADMVVYPTRWMHHLGGFEMGYAQEHWAAWSGAAVEFPENPGGTDAAWTAQQIEKAAAASVGLEARWPQGGAGGSRIGFAYLSTWGGNAIDTNPPPGLGGSQFEFRYPYRNALQLRFRTGASVLRLESEGKMTWDLDRGSLLGQIDFSFRPMRRWELLVGGTWIQSQSPSSPATPQAPDALGAVANLDSVTAGLRYTF